MSTLHEFSDFVAKCCYTGDYFTCSTDMICLKNSVTTVESLLYDSTVHIFRALNRPLVTVLQACEVNIQKTYVRHL